MKITKSNITVIITVIFGIVMLALQQPITNALMNKSDRIDAKFAKLYEIKETYKLPEALSEISGITWLSDNTFACVQDEDGIIYIYNVEQNKIKNEIKFANSGDYEGIAINKNDAFVMRSDGLLYEIKNFTSDSLTVSKFQTPFTKDNNIESLVFDSVSNSLLTVPKDEDLANTNLKCIYQIPLSSNKMDSLPLIKIDLKADAFNDFEHKKIHKTFNPSDIAIHPKTKDIYVIDGKKPKLLILNSKGDILKVHALDDRKFRQPEGISFSDDGRLYIANEAAGKGNSALIIEVELIE